MLHHRNQSLGVQLMSTFLAWLFIIGVDKMSCLDPPALVGPSMGADTVV